jgi:hypothetical protein
MVTVRPPGLMVIFALNATLLLALTVTTTYPPEPSEPDVGEMVSLPLGDVITRLLTGPFSAVTMNVPMTALPGVEVSTSLGVDATRTPGVGDGEGEGDGDAEGEGEGDGDRDEDPGVGVATGRPLGGSEGVATSAGVGVAPCGPAVWCGVVHGPRGVAP